MNCPPTPGETAVSFGRTLTLLQSLPFDLARAQYAAGVRVGLIEQSLLGWAKFERQVNLLEKLTLGPWARSV
jgi:hypothetical protein